MIIVVLSLKVEKKFPYNVQSGTFGQTLIKLDERLSSIETEKDYRARVFSHHKMGFKSHLNPILEGFCKSNSICWGLNIPPQSPFACSTISGQNLVSRTSCKWIDSFFGLIQSLETRIIFKELEPLNTQGVKPLTSWSTIPKECGSLNNIC